jgi:hypothetical protein
MVIKMVNDRELYVLGRQAADVAMTKGTVEQVRRLSDLAHQAYLAGSGAFNTSTQAFINLLIQLGFEPPESLQHYQWVIMFSAAQQEILDYRDQARSYEALKRTADRVKHGELAGTYSPERLEYVESQLSNQAKKLLAM